METKKGRPEATEEGSFLSFTKDHRSDPCYVKSKIHKRHTGEMNCIPFAHDYIVLETDACVTHWVKVDRIIQLREKLIARETGKVLVLFSADGFNYEVTNVDIVQFLLELHLAKPVEG